MSTSPTDLVTMTVRDRRFSGWKDVTIRRSLEECASSFSFSGTP